MKARQARDRRGRFQAPADAALAALFLDSRDDSAPVIAGAFEVTETEAREARALALDCLAVWDWQAIAGALCRAVDDDDARDDDGHIWLYLGSVLSVSPSCKVYTFWTSNQTRQDVVADAMWLCGMSARAEYLGAWIGAPDGCAGDDIFIGIDADSLDDVGEKATSLAMILSIHS